jgi:hypothetical protein
MVVWLCSGLAFALKLWVVDLAAGGAGGLQGGARPGFSWLLSRLVTLLEGRQPAVRVVLLLPLCFCSTAGCNVLA